MADLKCDSISVFSVRLARLVKGKSARLRASRIREHITISLSGPVPRSHSPDDFVRSSRVMRWDPWGGAGLAAGQLLRTLPARSPRGAEFAFRAAPWRLRDAGQPCRRAGWRREIAATRAP